MSERAPKIFSEPFDERFQVASFAGRRYPSERGRRILSTARGTSVHGSIDDAVLALLWLTPHNERWAWKGAWATTDRLHKKGLIGDPVNKSKSLVLIDEGLARSQALFRELFTRPLH